MTHQGSAIPEIKTESDDVEETPQPWMESEIKVEIDVAEQILPLWRTEDRKQREPVTQTVFTSHTDDVPVKVERTGKDSATGLDADVKQEADWAQHVGIERKQGQWDNDSTGTVIQMEPRLACSDQNVETKNVKSEPHHHCHKEVLGQYSVTKVSAGVDSKDILRETCGKLASPRPVPDNTECTCICSPKSGFQLSCTCLPQYTESNDQAISTSMKEELDLIESMSSDVAITKELGNNDSAGTRYKVKLTENCFDTNVQTLKDESHPVDQLTERGPYICQVCRASFLKSSDLETHVMHHTQHLLHNCDQCEKTCATASTQVCRFKSHGQALLGERPCICDEATCTKSSDRKEHKLICTHKNLYYCNECRVTFNQYIKLKIHELLHTKRKPYTFQQKTASAKKLKSDTLEATHPNPNKCTLCNVTLSTLKGLKNHVRLVHPDHKPYTCDQCPASFNKANSFKSHMWTHKRQKLHKCDQCQASFTASASLKKHRMLHTGEKPLACSHCPARFRSGGELKAHLLIHTGQKPHACSHCPATFRSRSQLSSHMPIIQGKNHMYVVCVQKGSATPVS